MNDKVYLQTVYDKLDIISISTLIEKAFSVKWQQNKNYIVLREIDEVEVDFQYKNVLIDFFYYKQKFQNGPRLTVVLSFNDVKRAKKSTLFFQYLVLRETIKNFI